MSAPTQEYGPHLPEGVDYALREHDINRLWRAQRAATLLATLDHETACPSGISHDGPAAVAEYIAEDVMEILNHVQRLSAAPTDPKGPDLI